MSERPKVSRRASSGVKKETTAKLKKQIEELTAENEALKIEAGKVSGENQDLKGKLEIIVNKIVECTTEEEKEDYEFDEATPLLDIQLKDVLDMLSKMVLKKLKRTKTAMEARIEDLETRITEQSMQVANLVKTRSVLEGGLFEMSMCSTMFEMRQKIEDLQYAIQEPVAISTVDTDVPPVCTDHIPTHQMSLVADLQKTSLQPPQKRFPGDTHIRYMHKELRAHAAKELSMEKISQQDWRMLAVRVGVPSIIVEDWRRSRLECPMMQVLSYWGRSEAATVRMLHRHLVSPQLRCILLAKRISTFYDLD